MHLCRSRGSKSWLEPAGRLPANQEAGARKTTSAPHIKLPPCAKLYSCYWHCVAGRWRCSVQVAGLLLMAILLLATEAAAALQLTPAPKTTTTTATAASQLYPVTSPFSVSTPPASTTAAAAAPSIAAAGAAPATGRNSGAPGAVGAGKTFKFTLTAGRFWRFNVKANSLQQANSASQQQPELRLHRNVSLNNYIIDDLSWFQYNPQQQQLFAWPPLQAKPGTYYFVLLPSARDFDPAEDEESFAGVADSVAANIIVELLRPVYAQPDNRDLDLYLDHRFTLNHLQRLSTAYPLLLSQRITTKQAPKLAEVALINYNYTPDGNLFSLTWSTLPSLLNNTIDRIRDCRLGAINDTVSRVSALALGQRADETNIYYPLDEPPPFSPQPNAIVPTERGNYTLLLTLSGPCRNETAIGKLLEQLEPPQPPPPPQEKTSTTDADDRDNNIALETTTQLANSTSATTEAVVNYKLQTSSQPAPPTRPPSIANKTPDSAIPTAFVSESQLRLTTPAADTDTYLEQDRQADKAPTTVFPHPVNSPKTTHNPPVTSDTPKHRPPPPPPPPTSTTTGFNLQLHQHPQQPVTQSATHVGAPKSSTSASEVTTTSIGLRSQQPNLSSSPKWLTKSLLTTASDSPIQSKERSINMANNTTTTEVPTTSPRDVTVHVTPLSKIGGPLSTSTTTIPPNTTDTTFNEDIMMILEDAMEYFVSIAVPVAVIVGIVLLISIIIAVISLSLKRRKAQHFQVKDRYSFRYGSERKGFLKTVSKPVIMEADQKMISIGGTPLHKANKRGSRSLKDVPGVGESTNYYPMHMYLKSDPQGPTGRSTGYYAPDYRNGAGSSGGINETNRNHD